MYGKNEGIYSRIWPWASGNRWDHNKCSSSICKYPVDTMIHDSTFPRRFYDASVQLWQTISRSFRGSRDLGEGYFCTLPVDRHIFMNKLCTNRWLDLANKNFLITLRVPTQVVSLGPHIYSFYIINDRLWQLQNVPHAGSRKCTTEEFHTKTKRSSNAFKVFSGGPA